MDDDSILLKMAAAGYLPRPCFPVIVQFEGCAPTPMLIRCTTFRKLVGEIPINAVDTEWDWVK